MTPPPWSQASLSQTALAGLVEIDASLDNIRQQLSPPKDSLRRLSLVLDGEDHVGLSFWLAGGLQLASTIFFFAQVFLVPRRWANSMIVAGIVCGVAWHHYQYMKDLWADTQTAPTVYRYMDWLITVPLQVTEFYLILVAATPDDKPPLGYFLFFRLMAASILMLAFGYIGETETMDRWLAFCCGCAFYVYILYELYFGEAAKTSDSQSWDEAKKFLALLTGEAMDEDEEEGNESDAKHKAAVQRAMSQANTGQTVANSVALNEFKKPEAQLAFQIIRIILLVGWMLYPVGYLASDGQGEGGERTLNAIYNLADLLNKVAFGLAIYYAAGSQAEREKAIVVQSKAPTVAEILEIPYQDPENNPIFAAILGKTQGAGSKPQGLGSSMPAGATLLGDTSATSPLGASRGQLFQTMGANMAQTMGGANMGQQMQAGKNEMPGWLPGMSSPAFFGMPATGVDTTGGGVPMGAALFGGNEAGLAHTNPQSAAGGMDVNEKDLRSPSPAQ
ncbi:unnamed protein product [Amoebophrya sp. A25]|nr:unnamed protein product [Amoebophrya sp. A25]|eukprot:GSA25T00021344001.1